MIPTDSINSYQAPHQNNPAGGGRPGVQGPRQKLPKDVLEALEKHDLERAMSLLRQYEAAGTEGANNFIASFMKMLLSALKFNFIVVRAPSKRAKKGEKTEKNGSQMKAAALIRGMVKMVVVPLKLGAKVLNIAVKTMGKVSKAAYRNIFKPAARVVAAPVIRSYEALRERYEAFAKVVDKAIEKVKERIDDIREKVTEKIDHAIKEFRELAKPVKIWLTHKFDRFVEKQQWFKEAMGQQLQSVVHAAHIMINILAYAVIPFTFAVKKAEKGGKSLKERFIKVKNAVSNAFNKAKSWVKGKLKKGFGYIRSVVQACAFAIERVWLLILQQILKILKKIWKWITAPFRAVINRFKPVQ